MQNSILKKCLEELGKEPPKLDYVRGMLETLIEFNSPQIKDEDYKFKAGVFTAHSSPISISAIKEPEPVAAVSEGDFLDAQARTSLAKTMELAKKSTETS